MTNYRQITEVLHLYPRVEHAFYFFSICVSHKHSTNLKSHKLPSHPTSFNKTIKSDPYLYLLEKKNILSLNSPKAQSILFSKIFSQSSIFYIHYIANIIFIFQYKGECLFLGWKGNIFIFMVLLFFYQVIRKPKYELYRCRRQSCSVIFLCTC